MKIYIIQEIVSGVPECPVIFLNEKEADSFYLRLVNEVHSKNFKNVKKAAAFVREEAEGNFHEIYYWATSPKKGG